VQVSPNLHKRQKASHSVEIFESDASTQLLSEADEQFEEKAPIVSNSQEVCTMQKDLCI